MMEAVPHPTETNEDMKLDEEPIDANASDDVSLDDVERLKEAVAHPTETNEDLKLIEEPIVDMASDVSLDDVETGP